MFYSDQKKQLQDLNRRAFFLLLGKVSLFTILGWRLYNIQIKDSQKYQTLSINNQIDVKILYPVRGNITDRNNNIIARNIKVFDLYIIPERVENYNDIFNALSHFVEIDFKKRRDILNLVKQTKKFNKIKRLLTKPKLR